MATIGSWEIYMVGKPIGKTSYGKLRRSLKGSDRGVEFSGRNAEVSILGCVLKNMIYIYLINEYGGNVTCKITKTEEESS
jgi:hypothetical protein